MRIDIKYILSGKHSVPNATPEELRWQTEKSKKAVKEIREMTFGRKKAHDLYMYEVVKNEVYKAMDAAKEHLKSLKDSK